MKEEVSKWLRKRRRRRRTRMRKRSRRRRREGIPFHIDQAKHITSEGLHSIISDILETVQLQGLQIRTLR